MYSKQSLTDFGRFIAAFLVACLLTAQTRRLEPITVSRKLALVIGNQAYQQSPLRNPVRDATAIGRLLSEMGFEVTLKQDVKLREMSEAIGAFTSHLHSGDLALFFYSGHGMQINGENYLNPIDLAPRDEGDVKWGSYSVKQLQEKLEVSGARLRVIILDACRDNPFHRTRGGSVGLSAIEGTAEGTLIAYATGDNNVADDNPGGANGLFTTHLIEALREPGLPLEGVFKRAKEAVYAASQKKQNPYTYSNVVGEFYFRPMAAPVSVPLLPPEAEVEYWRSIRDSADASLFEGYQRRYPNGQFTEIAEARIRALRSKITSPSGVAVGSTTEGSSSTRDPQDLVAAGRSLYAAGDDSGALSAFQQGANAGNVESMIGLGLLQERAQNYTQAIALYRRTAEAGSADGMMNYGSMFANGRGVAVDYSEALRWFHKAADAGSTEAMVWIGGFYRNGRGVTQDYTETLKWYQKASALGSTGALADIGQLYRDGLGVTRDYAEAMRFYRNAADGCGTLALKDPIGLTGGPDVRPACSVWQACITLVPASPETTPSRWPGQRRLLSSAIPPRCTTSLINTNTRRGQRRIIPRH